MDLFGLPATCPTTKGEDMQLSTLLKNTACGLFSTLFL